MKKVILWSVCALLSVGDLYAQAPPVLPVPSPIKVRQAHQQIQRFQSTANHDNSSFLISAFNPNYSPAANNAGIGDYILSTYNAAGVSPDCYLQIYLAANKWNAGASTASGYFLVIAAVNYNSITGVTTHVPGMLWMTSLAQGNCCVKQDQMDGTDNDDVAGCNIKNSSYGLLNTPAALAIAKQGIVNYQSINDPQQTGTNNLKLVTESFVISANDFRDYLVSGGTTTSNNPVQYIQFYLGKYKAPAIAGQPDSLSIILVGVENDATDATVGDHLFSTPSTRVGSYVFDEGNPCPTCNVNQDGAIDFHPQFLPGPGGVYQAFPNLKQDTSAAKFLQLK